MFRLLQFLLYYIPSHLLCIYRFVMLLLLCCTIVQILPENAEVDVEEEEIEELTVKSPSMLIQERQDLAEESGKVIILLDTPDKTRSTATIVVDEEEVEILPLFEEIRSAMGFSPLNNTTSDPVPHDEDLMGWHSPEAPRPNRRSIYDPIQIK